MIRKIGIAILLLVVVSSQAFAVLPTYSGSLSGANGGLVGTGSWLFKSLAPEKDQADWFAPTFDWIVSQNQDLSWHYDYTLSVYEKEISHLTVEASQTFTSADIWNAHGPFGAIEVQDFEPSQSSNPGMPSTIHGIKFDSTNGTTVHVYFDSDRAPVWGDIYAKDGVDKTTGVFNALWNAGFTEAPDVDPIAPITNGSYQNHVLVPDTTSTVTPEPASFVALAAGCIGLMGFMSRKRRNA